MNRPIVSVVVPTYNRPELLERCLQALTAQEFTSHAYEIIVVDDAASKVTRKQVEEWSKKTVVYALRLKQPNGSLVYSGNLLGQVSETAESENMVRLENAPSIRYIANHGPRGPAAARNTGWKSARAQIIAFTDDDCQPAAGWLSAGVSAILSGVDGVSGKIVMPIPEIPSDYERNAAGLENGEFVTANCFYRRNVLETVGGFDPRFQAAWREDTDLHFSALEYGFRLVVVPEAIVLHPVRKAPWGASIQQQKKSQYNALLYKKHPGLYRQKVQGRSPWNYYTTIVALLTALLGTGLKRPFTALTGALIWATMTTRFVVRRLNGTRHDKSHVLEMLLTSIFIPPLSVYWRLRGAMKFKVWFF